MVPNPKARLFDQVREVIDRHRGAAGIVYCLRRKDVDDMTAALKKAKYSAIKHGSRMCSVSEETPDKGASW